MFRLFSIVVLSIVGITHGFAASFDCSKAGTWVEHAICDNYSLSQMDSDLGAQYLYLRNNAEQIDEDILRKLINDQKAWLRSRNRCSNTTCLNVHYRQRIDQLDLLDGELCTVPQGVSPCIY